MSEEDEAFNDIERQAKQRKESVRAAINKEKPMIDEQQAFPDGLLNQEGMTLRDYFAAQVAVGVMSDYWNSDRMKDPTFEDIAQQAYNLADAMLKAREA